MFLFKGTIADREHRKWTEQAILLQNNPYTRESIERRRLSRGTLNENLSPGRNNARWVEQLVSLIEIYQLSNDSGVDDA